MIKNLAGGMVLVAATAGFAIAAVSVDVRTPDVRVQVGNPPPPPPVQAPPPQVRVIEKERVIIKEKEVEDRHDNGKHKGQHKGQKKHNKHKKEKNHDD